MHTAIVLAGGDGVDAAVGAELPAGALVIAADSGLHLADALGLHVDRVVGDLDSADPARVALAAAAGAVIDAHPCEKDATDLELALVAAHAAGAETIVVVGGGGGRLDHHLANLLLLASPALADVTVVAHMGGARVAVGHGGRAPVVVRGRPGSLLTLLPAGGPAHGIVTTGLRYPLRDESLTPGTSRGVSNLLTGHSASVRIAAGALLVVQPDAGKGAPS